MTEYRTVERFAANADGPFPHSATITELVLQSRKAPDVVWQTLHAISPWPCKHTPVVEERITPMILTEDGCLVPDENRVDKPGA